MQIIIEGKPLVKERPFPVKTKSGKVKMFTPQKTTSYENLVRLKASEIFKDKQPFSKPVSLKVVFYMPRPQHLIWKTKPMPVTFCDKRPDIDNLAKAVIDGLNGVAFFDDKQIVMLQLLKCYHSGNGKPKTIIDLKELSEIKVDIIE